MGSPFQCLTTLWVRKFLLISNLNWPWCHLRPFPHVIASHLREDANTCLTVTSFHIIVEKIFLSSNPVLLSVSFEKMRDLMKWQGLFKMTLGQTKENFSAGHSLMNAHARLSPSTSAVLISREAVLGPWLIETQISAVKGCPTVGKSGCEQEEFEIAGNFHYCSETSASLLCKGTFQICRHWSCGHKLSAREWSMNFGEWVTLLHSANSPVQNSKEFQKRQQEVEII